MYTIVLLTEKTLTDHDVQRLASLHDPEPVRIHVVVPCLDTDSAEEGSVARGVAQRQVADSVAMLLAAGVPEADGEVASEHPVDEMSAIATKLEADEIVVLTEPHLIADLTRRDWATRIRHTIDLPVLHVVLGTDQVVS